MTLIILGVLVVLAFLALVFMALTPNPDADRMNGVLMEDDTGENTHS